MFQLREKYKTDDPAELWREYGVIRWRDDERYSVLIGENGSGADVVFCFHDEGECADDAECYGFAQLAYMTGLAVVCMEGAEISDFPDILEKLKQQGVSCRRVFAFGKGTGGAAAVRCALANPTLVDGVCTAFAGHLLGETDYLNMTGKIPVMLISGSENQDSSFRENRGRICGLMQSVSGVETTICEKTDSTVERALGVRVHKGYYVMIEGVVWMVADWYSAAGNLAFRVMEGLELPPVITGAIAPFAYRFFTGK